MHIEIEGTEVKDLLDYLAENAKDCQHADDRIIALQKKIDELQSKAVYNDNVISDLRLKLEIRNDGYDLIVKYVADLVRALSTMNKPRIYKAIKDITNMNNKEALDFVEANMGKECEPIS